MALFDNKKKLEKIQTEIEAKAQNMLNSFVIDEATGTLKKYKGVFSEVYIPHSAHAEQGSVLHALYGSNFSINSHHHQAVKDLGSGLWITAWCDQVVEAFQHTSLPIWAVQFHPERMTGPDTVSGLPLFQFFVRQCANQGGK